VASEHFRVEQIFSFFTLNTLSSVTLRSIFTTYAVKLPALFDPSLHTSEQKVLPYQNIQLQNQNSPFVTFTLFWHFNGSLLQIFRDNLSVPSSKVKHSSGQEVKDDLTLEDGPIG
jgi:hypothetical protein